MRRGGSFGLLALVVVMGIVLFLVAQAWKKAAPEAPALDTAAWEETSDRPNLDEARQQTDAHTQDVEDALASID